MWEEGFFCVCFVLGGFFSRVESQVKFSRKASVKVFEIFTSRDLFQDGHGNHVSLCLFVKHRAQCRARRRRAARKAVGRRVSARAIAGLALVLEVRRAVVVFAQRVLAARRTAYPAVRAVHTRRRDRKAA